MPVRTNIEITGVKEAVYAGEKMRDHDGRKVKESILQCLDLIFDESQRLVPVDTQALMLSGTKVVEGQGFTTVGWIEYGGADAPYAWIVHEDLLATHEPPTQARYLSDASQMHKQDCEAILRRQFYSNTVPVTGG